MPQERLELLLKAVAGLSRMLILPHNDPDPDAIASAIGLRHLLAERSNVEACIAYGGIIGRAANKALVHYLGRPLRHLNSSDLHQAEAVALVDTQPGAGNNPLPLDHSPVIVVDHHPRQEWTAAASFAAERLTLRPQRPSLSAAFAASAICSAR
jgi:nanoRNase/pAp phosphatase (c-di-AMP/oligoRNAs hydrolase)